MTALEYIVSTPVPPGTVVGGDDVLSYRFHPLGLERYRYAPRLECKDGATVSVQAGPTAFCDPSNACGPWTHVECGYPSCEPPESWSDYGDDCDIYAHVPVAVVQEFIDAHGGERDGMDEDIKVER